MNEADTPKLGSEFKDLLNEPIGQEDLGLDDELNKSLTDMFEPKDQDVDEKSFLGLTEDLDSSVSIPRPKRSHSPLLDQFEDKGILVHGL